MSDALTKLGEAARRAREYISPWAYFSPSDVASNLPGGGIPAAVEPYKQGLQKTAEATQAFREGRWGDAARWYGSGMLDTATAGLSALPEGGALMKLAAWVPMARNVFHYTDAANDFAAKDFKTPRGAVYTSLTPQGAEIGGQNAGLERAVDGRAPRIMPLVSDAPVAGLDAPPAVKWPEALTGKAVDDLDAAIRNWNDPNLSPAQNEYARNVMWEVWDRGYKPSTGERVSDAVLEKSLNPGVDYKSFEGSRAHLGPNDLSGAEQAEALKALGYKGTRIIDDAPGSVAYFDPSVLRGRFEQPEGAMQKLSGIRAFHGSPHDFDRFDMSKIGTGEGAQAYGHGLYFAENEDVARGYRNALAPGMGDGALRAAGIGDADVRSLRQFTQSAVDPDVAMRDWLAWTGKKETPELRQAFMQEWQGRNPGKMYEVRINADPEHFLDWDKPLSEQPKAEIAVGRYLERALDQPGPIMNDVFEKFERGQMTGADVAKMVGTDTAPLREAGIPGIKYLDAGSRGAGDGTRNYVVFDDKLVEIIRKYGWAPGMAIPAAMALEMQQAQEQSAPQM